MTGEISEKEYLVILWLMFTDYLVYETYYGKNYEICYCLN